MSNDSLPLSRPLQQDTIAFTRTSPSNIVYEARGGIGSL